MTDPTTNPKTPAQRLATVLRALTPEALITVRGRYVEHHYYSDSHDFDPADRNHLARVVGMLSPEQRKRFSDYYWNANDYPDVHEVITAPPEVWLAALEAVVGAK